MDTLDPRREAQGLFPSRLQRRHSSLFASIVPWLSIMIASILPQFFLGDRTADTYRR